MTLSTKATEIPVLVADSNSINSTSRSFSPQQIKIMESKIIKNQQKQIIESKYSSSPSITASSASSASSTSFDGSMELGGDSHIKTKRTTSEHQPPLKKSRKTPNPPSLKSLKRVPPSDPMLQSYLVGNHQSYYASPIQLPVQVPVQVPVSNLNLNLNSPVYTLQTQFLSPQPQRQLVYSPNIGRMVSIPISQSSSSSSSIGQQTPVMMFQQIPVIHSPHNQHLIPTSVPVQQQQQLSQKSQQLKKQQNSSTNTSKSPLTSDVYDYGNNNDDENDIIGDYEEEGDDDDDGGDDDDDDEENVEANAISQDDKEINSKLFCGSITLDGWSSKFSIPLTGNEVEDKKHFDLIMSNAWKSSSSLRK